MGANLKANRIVAVNRNENEPSFNRVVDILMGADAE